MTEVCEGYSLYLPSLNQIIDKSVKDTLNIFTSLLELGKRYKLDRERNYFRIFIQRMEEILPKKVKQDVIGDIITKLPERQWLISDYDEIMEVFIKRITSEKIKDMDSLFKSTFKTQQETIKFVRLFFDEVVVSTKQNHEFWQNLILEEEDTEKMHIFNEISLSLKEMGDISKMCSRKRFDLRMMEVMKYLILQSLRITRTLHLLRLNKLDEAISDSRFLRSERLEMIQNA